MYLHFNNTAVELIVYSSILLYLFRHGIGSAFLNWFFEFLQVVVRSFAVLLALKNLFLQNRYFICRFIQTKLQFHIVTLFLLNYRFEFANVFIFKSQLFLYLFDMVLFHSQLLLNLLKNQGLLQELVFLLLFLLPQFLTVWNLLYAFTWSRLSLLFLFIKIITFVCKR